MPPPDTPSFGQFDEFAKLKRERDRYIAELARLQKERHSFDETLYDADDRFRAAQRSHFEQVSRVEKERLMADERMQRCEEELEKMLLGMTEREKDQWLLRSAKG